MARYKSTDKFDWNTANTIDDVTGVKTKLSKTKKRWDGVVTGDLNYEQRQPQDFPVTPLAAKVYTEARSEAEDPAVTPYNPDEGWSDL